MSIGNHKFAILARLYYDKETYIVYTLCPQKVKIFSSMEVGSSQFAFQYQSNSTFNAKYVALHNLSYKKDRIYNKNMTCDISPK